MILQWQGNFCPILSCVILQAVRQPFKNTTRLPEKLSSQDAPLNELPLQPSLNWLGQSHKIQDKGGGQNNVSKFLVGIWLLLTIMLLQLSFCFQTTDLELVPAFSSWKFLNRCLPSGRGKREACVAEEAERGTQYRGSKALNVSLRTPCSQSQFVPWRAPWQS